MLTDKEKRQNELQRLCLNEYAQILNVNNNQNNMNYFVEFILREFEQPFIDNR